MKNKLQILPIISFAILLSSCSQYYTQLGNSQYNAFGYKKASGYFEKAVLKKKKISTLEKLADCFYKINDYKNAEKYFKESVADAKCTPTTKLHYAQTLMSLGKYDEAKTQLNSVLAEQTDNSTAKSLLSSCNSIPAFVKDSNRYTVNKLDISGFESSFSPVVYKEGLVYAAEKKEVRRKEVYRGTMMGYAHLYYAKKDAQGKLGEPLELNGNVNKKFHNSTAAFANGGSEIYYSSVNSDKIKLSEKYSKVYNMSINHDSIVDNEWKKAKTFPYNSPDYSNSHPTLTADGKTMYFASDMPGGLGGSDIYMSKKSGNTWSKPVNLGKNINSEGTENFPFVDKEGNLFFASNGKAGLGGLDIFYTQINENHDAEVRNLGAPVNSNYDDFGLIFNNDQKKGYFSSNRKRGLNDDDIYAFNYTSKGVIVLNGKILSEEDKNPLDSTAIVVKGGDVDMTQTSLADGSFSLKLEKEKEYTINYKRNGFDEKSISYSTKGKKIPTFGNLVLDTIVYSPKTKIDSAQLKKIKCDEYRRVFYLDNIYFDLGKSLIKSNAKPILDSAINMLKNNPDVNLILSGHNNTIKNNKYSEALAKSRALAAYTYLIKNGIDKSRLNTEHHTSTVLLSTCGTGKKCPESEKQKDRRVEFMVVKSGINITLDCNLLPFTPAPLNPDEAKIANDIENIYYNTNQSTIREDAKQPLINLVQIMKQTPALNVLISGHADSRGSSAGNQNLSVKRAKAAMAFLIKNGIEKSRIQVEGFGEDKLVNKCIDGVECSPAEHQKNRRAEFYFRK